MPDLKRDELFVILASKTDQGTTCLLTFNMGSAAAPDFQGFTAGQYFKRGESAASCAAKLRELADQLEKQA